MKSTVPRVATQNVAESQELDTPGTATLMERCKPMTTMSAESPAATEATSWKRGYLPLQADTPSPNDERLLDEYRRAVRQAIKEKSSIEIANGSPRHARFILRCLFEQAQESVLIYSEHLTRVVYEKDKGLFSSVWATPNLVGAAKKFLRRSSKASLRILVENRLDGSPSYSGHDHPFIADLFSDPERKGTIELVVGGRPETNPLLRAVSHRFAVADSSMYRLETSKNGYEATASFNAPSFAEVLRKNFDLLVERAISQGSARRFFSHDVAPIHVPSSYLTDLAPVPLPS